MKLRRIYMYGPICIYIIILIDIVLGGKMLDILALVLGIPLFIFATKYKVLEHIFFISALGFMLLSILMYLISAKYLPFNAAADWAFFLFLFGIVKMFFESVSTK